MSQPTAGPSPSPTSCHLAVALAIAVAMAATSCSLVLSLDECEADTDCDDGWTCSADQLCQPPEDDRLSCDSDDDCAGQMTCNDLGVCQEPSDLLVAPCDQGAGDLDADDTFIVGVLLPLSGAEAGFGQPLFNAIVLAQKDFDSLGRGSVAGRNLAILACDTQGDDELALQGAQHLRDAGVQAVIGPDYSSQTIDVATDVTIDDEMVLVSPSATAAQISGLDDDFVWRTVASDTVQGQALGQLVNYALDERPHYEELDEEFIPDESSVALLRRSDDPYALGLREAVTSQLPDDIVASDDRLTVRSYANEAAGDIPDYAEVAADLVASSAEDGLGPDVIVVVGASEAWTLADFLHDEFDNPPLFIFADAARNTERAAEADEELRGRIWGTAPQNVGDRDYTPYNSFRFRYQDEFGDDPRDFQFVANAFDALYVVTLGATYDGGDFTGPSIAAGMHQLSDIDAQTFDPTSSDAQSAIQTLSEGQPINFRGASGELDFDEHGDPSAGPIVLWCFDDAGLPEKDVILDEHLDFHPRLCGDDAPEQNFCENHGDCSSDACCHIMGNEQACRDHGDIPELDEGCEPREACSADDDCLNADKDCVDGYCVDQDSGG